MRQALFYFGLVAALLRVSIAAGEDPRWPDERRTGAFYCHADFSLTGADRLLEELGTLQKDLQTTLNITPSREPIHLFLFQEKATYQDYLQKHFPKVPVRRALFIKGRGPGMVFAFRSPDFEIDIRHESTHALLQANSPGLPLWLDEGLAEYFEPPRSERAQQNPHHHVVRELALLGTAPPLETLEALQELRELGREEYRSAWAWVHFCLHGPREGLEELRAYLRDLEAGSPPGNLSQRLRRRIPNLEIAVVRHFRTFANGAAQR